MGGYSPPVQISPHNIRDSSDVPLDMLIYYIVSPSGNLLDSPFPALMSAIEHPADVIKGLLSTEAVHPCGCNYVMRYRLFLVWGQNRVFFSSLIFQGRNDVFPFPTYLLFHIRHYIVYSISSYVSQMPY